MKNAFRSAIVLLAILAPVFFTLSARAFLKEATQELHTPPPSADPTSHLPVESPPLVTPVISTPLLQAPAPLLNTPEDEGAPSISGPLRKPVKLSIPAISLSKPVLPVGLTSDGAMDVLDDPGAVGWYRLGAVPGQLGSAVMDAHVYQAFSRLKEVGAGDDIYVTDANGKHLHFVVTETKVYEYDDVRPLPEIFGRSDAARLNLITCYGDLTADRSTYTHRLVVFAELVP